jgi:3-oxo-5-alpha-steroid 4-dehydrogenase 1
MTNATTSTLAAAGLSRFELFVIVWLAVAVAVFVLLFFVTAPYGRHVRRGWGATLPARLGWLLMEAPSPLVFAAFFAFGAAPRTATAWVFLALWEAHYVHRAFIYPWMLHDAGRRMPLSVVAMAIGFNSVNAAINGVWLFDLSGGYPTSWLTDPRFLAGLTLFVAGFVVNRHADATLRALRRRGGSGYAIPQGGLYRWVSCPNYLGEIVEWCGWALATWSLPGLAFAVWTAANLVPRARANHRWYREHFADYPPERKALLPHIW